MNTLPFKIHDSQNGLDYTLVGDYYLPDLEIESSQLIGKFGRARMKYLKEHRPGLYSIYTCQNPSSDSGTRLGLVLIMRRVQFRADFRAGRG